MAQAIAEERVFVSRSVRYGAILLIIGAVEFVVGMAVTPLGWTTPYSLLNNQISDLGSVQCGYAYAGTHYAFSPWHDIFNASAVLLGQSTIFGSILIRSAFPARRSRAVELLLLVVVGVGAVGVGLFPWDANGPAHYSSALVAFLFGNLAVLVLGVAMLRGARRRVYAVFNVVGGMVGLVALIVYLVLFSSNYGATPGLGGLERIAVAPILVWEIVAGMHLLRTPAYGPGHPSIGGRVQGGDGGPV